MFVSEFDDDQKATQCCVAKSTGYDLNVTPEKHPRAFLLHPTSCLPFGMVGASQWGKKFHNLFLSIINEIFII